MNDVAAFTLVALGAALVATRTRDMLPGGRADRKRPSDFNKQQLRKGIRVEMEHTNDPRIAEQIASDHLAEHPRYYIELDKMEKRLKRQSKKRKVAR